MLVCYSIAAGISPPVEAGPSAVPLGVVTAQYTQPGVGVSTSDNVRSSVGDLGGLTLRPNARVRIWVRTPLASQPSPIPETSANLCPNPGRSLGPNPGPNLSLSSAPKSESDPRNNSKSACESGSESGSESWSEFESELRSQVRVRFQKQVQVCVRIRVRSRLASPSPIPVRSPPSPNLGGLTSWPDDMVLPASCR